jgi:hypothetical protein
MKDKIAILYTTFLRDELMQQTITSILDNWKHYYVLLIADQGHKTEKKDEFYQSLPKDNVFQYYIPFDSGLSFGRNFLVDKALEYNCNFSFLTADSIKFTSKYRLEPYMNFLQSNSNYGIIGFELDNRLPWEYNMKKTNTFELRPSGEFIEYEYLRFKKIDICRNFFLAKTNVLKAVGWDNNLKMAEHEDFFWRVKTEGNYSVFFNNIIQARYISYPAGEYNGYRIENMYKHSTTTCKKYNLQHLYKTYRKD